MMPASMSLPVCPCAHAAPPPAVCPLGNARVPTTLASPWCRVRSNAAPAPCAACRLPRELAVVERRRGRQCGNGAMRPSAPALGGLAGHRPAPAGTRPSAVAALCRPARLQRRPPLPALPCVLCCVQGLRGATARVRASPTPSPASAGACSSHTPAAAGGDGSRPAQPAASAAALCRSDGSSSSSLAAAAAAFPSNSLAASSGGMGLAR
jgi:hypothetical protein